MYLRIMELPSRLMEVAVDQMASLPGIGRKTALRLVLQLLKRDEDRVAAFSKAFTDLRAGVHPCPVCSNLTEADRCGICSDPNRDERIICVVEDLRDLLAIEQLGLYKGRYHVLGGIISPMDGVGPKDLTIEGLVARCQRADWVKGVEDELPVEVIFALPTTMEGETTAFYLYKKLSPTGVRVTAIARGIAVGDDLQHADEATLAQSLNQRLPYST
jgi:recombination protein RecR